MKHLISNESNRSNTKNAIIILLATLLFTVMSANGVLATFVEMEKAHIPTQTAFQAGDIITFEINITVRTENNGAVQSIENLKIIDDLPTGLVFNIGNRTSSPQAINFKKFENGTLIWDFGPGPFVGDPQAAIKFNVTATSDAPENVFITNTAKAIYTETVSGVPSAPSVTDNIKIVYPVLDIDKTCSGPIREGGNIVYTITLQNTGHADAINIAVTDFLPTGVNFTPGLASSTSGTVDDTTLPNRITWNGDIQFLVGLNTVTITLPVEDDPLIVSDFLLNNASYTDWNGVEEFVKYWDSCETPILPPEAVGGEIIPIITTQIRIGLSIVMLLAVVIIKWMTSKN